MEEANELKEPAVIAVGEHVSFQRKFGITAFLSFNVEDTRSLENQKIITQARRSGFRQSCRKGIQLAVEAPYQVRLEASVEITVADHPSTSHHPKGI